MVDEVVEQSEGAKTTSDVESQLREAIDSPIVVSPSIEEPAQEIKTPEQVLREALSEYLADSPRHRPHANWLLEQQDNSLRAAALALADNLLKETDNARAIAKMLSAEFKPSARLAGIVNKYLGRSDEPDSDAGEFEIIDEVSAAAVEEKTKDLDDHLKTNSYSVTSAKKVADVLENSPLPTSGDIADTMELLKALDAVLSLFKNGTIEHITRAPVAFGILAFSSSAVQMKAFGDKDEKGLGSNLDSWAQWYIEAYNGRFSKLIQNLRSEIDKDPSEDKCKQLIRKYYCYVSYLTKDFVKALQTDTNHKHVSQVIVSLYAFYMLYFNAEELPKFYEAADEGKQYAGELDQHKPKGILTLGTITDGSGDSKTLARNLSRTIAELRHLSISGIKKTPGENHGEEQEERNRRGQQNRQF